MSRCEHSRQVNAYHDGALPAEERIRLETHIAQCPDCAMELQRLKSLSQWLAAARMPELPPNVLARLHGAIAAAGDRSLVRTLQILTAAAAIVLVATALWFWRSEAGYETPSLPPATWEETAVTQPRVSTSEEREFALARWIVEDLSRNHPDE